MLGQLVQAQVGKQEPASIAQVSLGSALDPFATSGAMFRGIPSHCSIKRCRKATGKHDDSNLRSLVVDRTPPAEVALPILVAAASATSH